MKNFIINELRKCSSIYGKQKTWVSELSDEQLYQLYKRLLNGEKAKSIARYVQKKWNVKPNSTVHSISQGILKFKKRIALLLEESKSDAIARQQAENTELESPIGNLESNELIARNLRQRIQNIIKEEKETGIKYPYLSRDIQALTSFEKTIVKQKEWRLKHPNDDPLKVLEIEKKDRKIDRLFNTFMNMTNEDQRNRMINFLERLIEIFEENALTVSIGVDGRCTLKD
jgi:hypothetical protein